MGKKKVDNDRETIAAIITPPGEGGLGAIRIAGEGSAGVLEKIFRPTGDKMERHRYFHMYYGLIVGRKDEVIDEVTLVEMPEGGSYTGQRQAEIFCHGGQVVLRRILNEIFRHGARPAEPGEFTRRAFLSGRIDLTRAEAVAELVSSKTEIAYQAARRNLFGELSGRIEQIRSQMVELLADIEADIDFPEEHLDVGRHDKHEGVINDMILVLNELSGSYRSGKLIKEGYRIAIGGRTNAGKSSLFNILLNQNRAIVAPTPGTTRDYLTEWIDMDGMAVSLTDTAGLRATSALIEKAGQEIAGKIIEDSDLIFWLVDISDKQWGKYFNKDIKRFPQGKNVLLIFNKIDLADGTDLKLIRKKAGMSGAVLISCKTMEGLRGLQKRLTRQINQSLPDLSDRLVVTSERHKQKLELALKYLKAAKAGLAEKKSSEFLSFDLRQGLNAIDEITGRIYNEEVLESIFSRFCIGK